MAGHSANIMTQSYLLQLIKILQPEERSEASLFIASSYFQRGKQEVEAQRLFSIILESAPDFLDERLKKEAVYRRLFPGEKPVDGKLEKIMVSLSKLIRTFLLFRHYHRNDNEFYQELDWARLLRRRGLESRFQQKINALKKSQEENPSKNVEGFYKQFLLEYEIHDWNSYHNLRKGNLNVPNVLHNLDLFYHINRLELLSHLLLQQKVAKVEEPEQTNYIFEDIALPEIFLKENPLLLIIEKIYRLFKTQQPNIKEYYALIDAMVRYEQAIEPRVIQQYYAYLRSVSALLINSGFTDLLPVLLQIFKHNLEKGYLYYENKISYGALASVTNVGLRMKEYDWTLNFIESHKDRIIGENESRDYYRLNLASYHFVTGNFEKALDLLPVNAQDWECQFMVRRLRLKIYYELDSELLPYELDSFKMLVSRSAKKVPSSYFQQLQSNFVNLLYQIIHSPRGDKDRVQRLCRRIESKKVLAEKDWLLEKAKALA